MVSCFLLAIILSIIWDRVILKILINKKTPDQILFYDAKYLTKEKDKKIDIIQLFSKTNYLKNRIKNKHLSKYFKKKSCKNFTKRKNNSFTVKNKIKLDIDGSFSYINDLNNELERNMSSDKIHELKEIQYKYETGNVNFYDNADEYKYYSMTHMSIKENNSSSRNIEFPRDINLYDIKIEIPPVPPVEIG